MKKAIATLGICIVLGLLIILGYAIFLNADGITEAFISFPPQYLFWFILGVLVGGVFTPFVYRRFKLLRRSKKHFVEEKSE